MILASPSPFRLAAIALLVLESEEDAFWCLVAVVEAIMPQDYYTKTLISSQVMIRLEGYICFQTTA